MPAARCSGIPRVLIALALVAGAVAARPTDADARLTWNRRLAGCEPPARFYSNLHQPGRRPCCPLAVGLCPGGETCPGSGVCPTDGVACQPGEARARPNVLLMLSDDQGACHYGTDGECRSVQTGTPIPAPVTPNLDVLAGHSTVFPIAHNTAAWCFPSINSLLTGRYQRSFGGSQRIADDHPTLPKVMRALGGDPSAPPDPFDPDARIGGYCSFLGGKFTAAIGDHGFDAEARGRRLGRTSCSFDTQLGLPRCGSEEQAGYDPRRVASMEELFEFLESLVHRVPGPDPGRVTTQPFFAWYAPRVPHAPLRSPLAINEYLFGQPVVGGYSSATALGGLFDLGRWCSGGVCPAVVRAFDEKDFGNQREYYGNLWWLDDNVREIRKYLAIAGAPHCIGPDGMGHYPLTSPETCVGTWVTPVRSLEQSTVVIYLTDNGWYLPKSKHNFTENGHRTKLMVFDPRNLETIPAWDADPAAAPPPNPSRALAHAVDVLPTALGYALGEDEATLCPTSGWDGTRCDGHDLRPYLVGAPGGAAPSENLRHSLCGHQTKRGTTPTKNRYLVTRPGSVGRCTNLAAAACESAADCQAEEFCLGARCMPAGGGACAQASDCPSGALCLAGRCESAPPCLRAVGCDGHFPAGDYACVAADTLWCRNAPNVACATGDDCPACPTANGHGVPCGRVCEPRVLKLYVSPRTSNGGQASTQLVDLFLDPDEESLHAGFHGSQGTLLGDMSRADGPFATTARTLNCCVDDWWPEPALENGTTCQASCPADLVCNQ